MSEITDVFDFEDLKKSRLNPLNYLIDVRIVKKQSCCFFHIISLILNYIRKDFRRTYFSFLSKNTGVIFLIQSGVTSFVDKVRSVRV